MSDPALPWMITGLVAPLAATVVALALYINRQQHREITRERERAERAEAKLNDYERPALDAARQVDAITMELWRRSTGQEPPPSKPRPRAPQRGRL